jgi:hypothetical protein
MVTSSNDSIPTPVVQKNRLLISGLMLELEANTPAAKVLWPETMAASKRILSNTSTPLFQGDCVYSAKSSGELVCLEAGSGKQIWGTTNVTELKFGASIHLTPSGDAVFLFTDEGNLILAGSRPAVTPRDQPRASAQTNVSFGDSKVCVDSAGLRQSPRLCPQRRGTSLRFIGSQALRTEA